MLQETYLVQHRITTKGNQGITTNKGQPQLNNNLGTETVLLGHCSFAVSTRIWVPDTPRVLHVALEYSMKRECVQQTFLRHVSDLRDFRYYSYLSLLITIY